MSEVRFVLGGVSDFENYFNLENLLAMSPWLTRCTRSLWTMPLTKIASASVAVKIRS